MGHDRRTLLGWLVGFAAAPAAAVAATPFDFVRRLLGGPQASPAAGAGAAVRHVTPDGEGNRDGLSWANAADARRLNELIEEAGPGGTILIAADRGRYTLQGSITLSHGGAAGRPVTIKGVNAVDGTDARAEIWGERADPFTASGETGAECFRFVRGADHLAFKNLHFRNIGNGCFRIGAPVQGLAIEDCTFRNVYRFIENTVSGEEADASLSEFVVRRCSGSSLERSFLRIRYRSNNGLIEDCRADSEGNEGDPFAVGCALEDAANTIIYRRCVMENFRQSAGEGAYWNADGFSDEWDNYEIRYEQCEARGATDAGFDCKSAYVVLQNCLAEDNKINIKIWSPRSTIEGCISRRPNWRGRGQENGGSSHFWYGHRPGIASRITNLIVEDENPTAVFWFEGPRVRVQVDGYALACHDEATLIAASEENPGGTVTFNPPTMAPASRRAPAIVAAGNGLRVQKGLWAANPRPSYAYQWRRNGAPIAGATQDSYAPAAADAGQALSVSVTARNSAGAATGTSQPFVHA
ncbi:MAG: hypothetical protein JNJ73_03750 [Hyphomonadaceae bacterium]|nr:hypothetical protein [Hyphomonadaceae bacterium]